MTTIDSLSDEHREIYNNHLDHIARLMVDAFLEVWPDDISRLNELFMRLSGQNRFECLIYLHKFDNVYLEALAPRLNGKTPEELRQMVRFLRSLPDF